MNSGLPENVATYGELGTGFAMGFRLAIAAAAEPATPVPQEQAKQATLDGFISDSTQDRNAREMGLLLTSKQKRARNRKLALTH